MIASIGPIGLAILVVGALLTLVCLFRKPAPDPEPSQDEPQDMPQPQIAPQPMTRRVPAPEAPEVQPQDIRPYANGAVTLGESNSPVISVRKPKEAAK